MKQTNEPAVDDLLKEAYGHFCKEDYTQTLALCERILEQDPKHLQALNILGISLIHIKDFQNAQRHLQQATALYPKNPTLWLNLGESCALNRQTEEALTHYQQALSLAPAEPRVHQALGNLWLQEARFDKAISSFYRALKFGPEDVSILFNYGVAQFSAGQTADAIVSFSEVLLLDPHHLGAAKRLGIAHRKQGDKQRAIEHYEAFVSACPGQAEIHHALGQCYTLDKQASQALKHFQIAFELAPNLGGLKNNLALALHNTGDSQKALELLTTLVQSSPTNRRAHSNRCLTAHYSSTLSDQELHALHLAAGQAITHALPAPFQDFPHRSHPQRRLRVGFVSPDFRAHPVGWFLLPLFKHRDPASWECYCYSDVPEGDALTEQLQSLADHFHDVSGESDQNIVEAVRRDQIDILIDLAGHTANNRLRVFAHKPAPIQASGMGYVNTTGLRTMDYLISDHHQTPEGVDGLYTETLARLPKGYITYAAPDYIPNVTPLPALQKGHLTLGCMNRLAKLTPETLKLWAAVLAAIPDATLFLQTNGLEDPHLAKQLVHRLATEGVSPQRVTLAGSAPHQDFLRAYHAVDIALDPVPYSGGLVTCEALWMGVPVVTLKGKRFAGLHSTSHLRNAGLPDWVADSPEQYISTVKSWSERLPELSTLRAGLRAQAKSSPLGDSAQYAHDFESFLQESWKTWCTEQNQ